MGYAIEFDVQLLADGAIAVFHDEGTARMTGVDRLVRECEAEEICSMRLLGSDQYIPLFDEVLELVDGRVPLFIELKNMNKAGTLERVLMRGLRSYGGPFAVQSFNPWSVYWFRRHAPQVLRGQLSGSFDDVSLPWHRKYAVKKLLVLPVVRPHFVGYEASCLPTPNTSRLRIKGMPLIGWTVKSMEEYRRVRNFCDNIIFEGFDPRPERGQQAGT
jgi:glycerophosphoryl diester phosphodiesterase